MGKYTFEICANSVESCIGALRGGAQRVELCAGIPEGGTTPSFGEIKTARTLSGLKLNVIIRPRGGDFIYSVQELKAMAYDIEAAKDLGVDGLVFGCLDEDGYIDIQANERLMKVAGDCPVTFHRAFDRCRNPFRALEEIKQMAFARILTSGQQPTAPQGAELIRQLVEKADDDIIIMPGCGVNENNIRELAHYTGAHEFHFSAREKVKSRTAFRNPAVMMGNDASIDEFSRDVTTSKRVRATIEALTIDHQ